MTFRGGTLITGRPLGVVTTPPTTLFTVVAAEVDKPINDLDNTARREPLEVMTGNETVDTKRIILLSLFYPLIIANNGLARIRESRRQTCVSILLIRRQKDMSAGRGLN